MRQTIAGYAITDSNMTEEQITRKIEELNGIMHELKKKVYRVNDVEYNYSKTEIKALEWRIATLINQLILKKNEQK